MAILLAWRPIVGEGGVVALLSSHPIVADTEIRLVEVGHILENRYMILYEADPYSDKAGNGRNRLCERTTVGGGGRGGGWRRDLK